MKRSAMASGDRALVEDLLLVVDRETPTARAENDASVAAFRATTSR